MSNTKGLVAVAMVVALAIGAKSTPAAATDLSSLGRDEITTLQRRLADAGCYRVRNLVSGDQGLNHRTRIIHSVTCIRRQQCGTAFDRDLTHSFERQIVSAYVKGFHKKQLVDISSWLSLRTWRGLCELCG